MKPNHLQGQGQNFGLYGGVGFKPGVEHWKPGSEATTDTDEPVPARFRRLRVRRTRRRRPQEMAPGEILPILFVAGFTVLGALYLCSLIGIL